MKRLGPQLKAPRVPRVARDLYADLRDRRLLPLLALLCVAIAAVPFVLRERGGEAPSAGEAPIAPGAASQAARLTVVEATPGVRDYRRRLGGKPPADPFKQKYTAPVLEGAKLNPPPAGGSGSDGGGDGVGGGKASPQPAPAPGGGSGGSGGGTKGGSGGKGSVTVVAYSADIAIRRAGGRTEEARRKSAASKPTVRRGVMPQTPLPGEKAPVVTYLGPVREGSGVSGKALLLVSRDVVSVFGDVRCAEGREVCQLIEAEPGLPISFVYGASEVVYTVTVRAIRPVTARGGSR